MIVSLTLVDFMAHARTTLELAPGLNVLCGPNNSGKSAIVEALRCLVTNPSPRHAIRHGASEARVEALLEGGWRVCWVRRKSYAIYEVFAPGAAEPEVYAKLGKGGVPEEVARLLKLAPVSFEKGQEVDVHLGDQRHPIFLLDQPGSLLADFLASSTESAHLMAMQDLLHGKVRRSKIAIKGLEDAAARAAAGLDRLADLPARSLAIETLREDGARIERAERAVPRLEGVCARLDTQGAHARALRRRAAALSELGPAPGLAPSAALASRLAAMDALAARAGAARASASALGALQAPPVPGPAPALAGLLGRVERSGAIKASAARRLAAIEALAPPPEPAAPSRLAALIGRMEAVGERIENGRAWMARREKELEAAARRIAARLEEVGECPLCGQHLDAGLFLEKRGGGRGAS